MYTYGTPDGNQYEAENVDKLLASIKKLHFTTKVREAYGDNVVNILMPLVSAYKDDIELLAGSDIDIECRLYELIFMLYIRPIIVVLKSMSQLNMFWTWIESTILHEDYIESYTTRPYRLKNKCGGEVLFITAKDLEITTCGQSARTLLVVI